MPWRTSEIIENQVEQRHRDKSRRKNVEKLCAKEILANDEFIFSLQSRREHTHGRASTHSSPRLVTKFAMQ